nr:reverse transcriptase domain-containing protein [Tanacetum cinerariifolium]
MSIPHNNQGLPPVGPPPPNNNGPPPVAKDFGLRHHMIQQVQKTCQFHGLPDDDANRHIDKFLEVTQHMKQNRVFDDALRLSLFPYSLTHHATTWYDRIPRNFIYTFDDMMRKFLSKYFPPSMVTKLRNEITKFRQDLNESLFEAWEHYKHQDTINAAARGTLIQKTPKECYELIENMTAHHNHWDTSATRDETSRNISSTTTTESPKVVRQLEMINKNFLDMMRQMQSVKYVDSKCETCGGPHSYTECPAVDDYTQEFAYATTGKCVMNFELKFEDWCIEEPSPDPESLIRRRNLGDPPSLFDFEEVMTIPYNNQGPPPAGPPPHQNNNGPPPVVRPNGPASRSMEELCQPHIDKILEVTQHMKQNGVSDDALRLCLFPYSLTHHATAWYDRLSRNSIHTFNDMMRKFLSKYFPPSMDTSATRDETSRNISSTTTTESPEVIRQLEMINKNFLDMMRQMQSVKSVNTTRETCGGPHSNTECLAVDGYTQEAAYATTGNHNLGGNSFQPFLQMQSPSGSGSLPSNTVANPRGDLKAITTRSGVAYDGPTILPTPSPLPKELERETEATKDKVQHTSSESTAHVQPLVVQVTILEPEVAPKPNPKPFVDALLHIPKFASTFKSLLSNKEKLFELASTPLNENCSMVLLKKLPKKLGDPDKFFIPCDFPKLEECLALADLGARINLMPLSVWKKLPLPELTHTRMTLELAN